MMRKNEAKWIERSNRWQINVQVDGVRRTFVSSTPGIKGKIEAEKKADHWLETKLVNETTRCDILLRQFLDHLKISTSASHWRQQKNYIDNYMCPIIGKKQIGRLTEADLQKIIDNAFCEKNLAKKTLSNLRACCVAFTKFCRQKRCTAMVPEDLTVPASAKRSHKKILSLDDLLTLFRNDQTSWCRGTKQDWYIHAYRFAVLTGLRPGELLGLKWSDIKDNLITIRRSINDNNEITEGKNENANRSIKIKSLAKAELDAQKMQLLSAGLPLTWVFPSRQGTFTKQQNYRKSWARYRKYNGLTDNITPYELRHTYVSVCDDMPEGLKQKALGHSKNMDTEGTYGHLKAGDLDRAAQYSNDAFMAILYPQQSEKSD